MFFYRWEPVFTLAFIWTLVTVATRRWAMESVAYAPPALGAATALALVSLYISARLRVESPLLAPRGLAGAIRAATRTEPGGTT